MESSNITELESSSQESIIYQPNLRPSEIGGFKVVIDEDIKINSKRNMMGVEHSEPVLEKRQKIEIPYSDSSEFIPDTPPIRLSPERDLHSPAFFSEVFSPKIEKIDLTKPMISEAKIQKNETHKLETSVIETPVIEATKLEVETHIESSKTLKTYDFLVNKTRAMDKTKNISSNYVWTGTEIASGTFGRVYKIDLNPTNESDIVYENGRDLKIKIPKSQVVIKRVDGRHKNHVNDAELEAKYMRLLQSHQFQNFGNSECYQYSHFVAQMIDSFYHQDYQNSTQDYLILMPLYSGDNLLQKYIKQGKRPTMKSSLNISYQLIAGLAFIESGGFIHADLKPENVQFEKQGSDKLRIIDFGSAEKSTDISKTRDVCTDMYRPPEVVLRCSTSSHEKHPFYSTNVDVWSAGCIIFELLHGRVLTDIDSDVDYDRFNRIADMKSKHFWDGFEIDCPGIDRYLMIFRQEYCYFLSRISEINPECPGFISEVVIAGNEEWEVVAKGEYQAHLVEHTDNKYKWYEFASFMKSRGGTDDNGKTYQVKLAKWSFKFPKTWFSDNDISDENRGKLVYRVDYELYEDRDLKPSFTIPENLENKEQRSIKTEKTDTDSDPKTRLEQRYKKLAETMMKMLIISPYKRSSASKLIKTEFDPTDYLNFIELPESAPPSARNSQERSAFSSKFRNSHKRDENYVNSGNRFDRFRSPSFTNSAERSCREKSGREISSSSINHSQNFNRNRSNVLSAKHFQTDRYNNHSNDRKISNYQGGNNYQSSNNYQNSNNRYHRSQAGSRK